MKFIDLKLDGLKRIELDVFEDERGFFMESYSKKIFAENGIDIEFVQDNYSKSIKSVLRGLHYQIEPFAQDKLVRVIKGKVFDVAVDIRKDSLTYGKWHAEILSEEEKVLFFIPKGFAHGFAVISDEVEFEYKVSNFYSKESDRGIMYNDPDINIEWPILEPILSEKDLNHPKLTYIKDTF